MRLENHVANLHRRRDHLLAVNARLSVPLTSSQMAYAATAANTPDRSTPGKRFSPLCLLFYGNSIQAQEYSDAIF